MLKRLTSLFNITFLILIFCAIFINKLYFIVNRLGYILFQYCSNVFILYWVMFSQTVLVIVVKYKYTNDPTEGIYKKLVNQCWCCSMKHIHHHSKKRSKNVGILFQNTDVVINSINLLK